MNRLDRAALLVIACLILCIGLSSWIGNPAPLQVTCLAGGETCTSLSSEGTFQLNFSRAVDEDAAAALVRVEPGVAGRIVWEDEHTARFIPAEELDPDQAYTIQVQTGRAGANGERIRGRVYWPVTIREPDLLFLKATQGGQEIFCQDLDPDGKALTPPAQLTRTDGLVREFAISPDGEEIAVAVYNQQGGSDLWLMSRDGSDFQTLLNCGAERCASPSWAPDGLELAYTRQSLGIEPGAPLGPYRVWRLNRISGESQPLYDQSDIPGYGPLYSPDGEKISIFDGVNGVIRVVDLETGEELLLKSNSGRVGAWTPDGQQLAYTDTILVNAGHLAALYLADIQSGKITVWLGGAAQEATQSYDLPAWRPRKGSAWQAAISVNNPAQGPAWQIWIVALYDLEPRQVTTDPDYTTDFYSWDESGERLLFQREKLGQPAGDAEIMIYNAGEDTLETIAQGRNPAWLP